MEPKYFVENRYSFVVDALPVINNTDYEVDTPETAFERSIQFQLAHANRLLMVGKYGVALAKYRHLRGLISATINPRISVPNGTLIEWATVNRTAMVDTVVARSADILKKAPLRESAVPAKFRGGDIALPETVAKQLAALEEAGVNDRLVRGSALVDDAETLTRANNFRSALEVFQAAFRATDLPELQGAILHDVAILQERTGNRDEALRTIALARRSFEAAGDPELQVAALSSQAGIQARGGAADAANATLKQADELRRKHNVFPILTKEAPRVIDGFDLTTRALALTRARPGDSAAAGLTRGQTPLAPRPFLPAPAAERQTAEQLEAEPVRLLAAGAFAARQAQKQLSILDSKNAPQRVQLDSNAAKNLATFYETLKVTADPGLLMCYLGGHTLTVAYLTHIYFWVIPMAMGDCYVALGSYAEAEAEYLSTINYKYLNQVVEAVNLWLRLAELYLDWGDRLYRQAGNVVAEFGAAREKYEQVLRLDNTIDQNSPLYAEFDIRRHAQPCQRGDSRHVRRPHSARRESASDDRADAREDAVDEDRQRAEFHRPGRSRPALQLRTPPEPGALLRAARLAGRTSVHPVPEHGGKRGTARAADGPAGRPRRGVSRARRARARRGGGGCGCGAGRTSTPRMSSARTPFRRPTDFASVRWELLELDSLQAWSSAAAVDEDDEVQQTISGFTYYRASSKHRSDVLFDLARQRTRITHDLEADRLQREIAAAQAYRAVAQQQVQQAQARVAVAEQRVAIAQMQEQHARENLDFLEGREFSSAMWYNLAREARRLAQRYLDTAIEVAHPDGKGVRGGDGTRSAQDQARVRPQPPRRVAWRGGTAARYRFLQPRLRADQVEESTDEAGDLDGRPVPAGVRPLAADRPNFLRDRRWSTSTAATRGSTSKR